MTQQTVRSLSATPLGQELGLAHVESLAELVNVESLAAGESLFEAGDAPVALHILVQGKLHVELPGRGQENLVIAILEPGGIVGELEAFTGDRRMARVVAAADSTYLSLSLAALKSPPEAQRDAMAALVNVVARVLAMRLAAVNQKLANAWSLPEAGAKEGDLEAPSLHDVLDDVLRW